MLNEGVKVLGGRRELELLQQVKFFSPFQDLSLTGKVIKACYREFQTTIGYFSVGKSENEDLLHI